LIPVGLNQPFVMCMALDVADHRQQASDRYPDEEALTSAMPTRVRAVKDRRPRSRA
jgi:hypothetical protein